MFAARAIFLSLVLTVLAAWPSSAAVQFFTDRESFEAKLSTAGLRQYDEGFGSLGTWLVQGTLWFLRAPATGIEIKTNSPLELSHGGVDFTALNFGFSTEPLAGRRLFGFGADVGVTGLGGFGLLAGNLAFAVRTERGEELVRFRTANRFGFVGVIADRPTHSATVFRPLDDEQLFLALDSVTTVTPIPVALPPLAPALGGLAFFTRRHRRAPSA